jgi:hypothetical protein
MMCIRRNARHPHRAAAYVAEAAGDAAAEVVAEAAGDVAAEVVAKAAEARRAVAVITRRHARG